MYWDTGMRSGSWQFTLPNVNVRKPEVLTLRMCFLYCFHLGFIMDGHGARNRSPVKWELDIGY